MQQTQVSSVIPYYQKFLARFPTLADLASASEEEVLALWAGLGYYARGRHLYHAAQRIMNHHQGIFPSTLQDLAELPGIGRSTAAAIAVFSFGTRAAILDGNVKRVLCRHAALSGYPGSTPVNQQLWALAESLLPDTSIEAYTQGLMDLGSTVCLRQRPDCQVCPLSADCQAHAEGRENEFPTKKPRKKVPERCSTFVLVSDGDSVLLQRRPPCGIWGGLLTPPEGSPETVLRQLALECQSIQILPVLKHRFSHFQLNIQPILCYVAKTITFVHDPSWCWQRLDQLQHAALPTPVRKILADLSQHPIQNAL